MTLATWRAGLWAATVLCWVVMAFIGHIMLLTLHEAAHYHLSRRRWLNEARGMILGTLSFMPLSVYRHVHRWHHARLGTEHDTEVWPYNLPSVPRWLRVATAIVELTISFPFTQVQFLRGLFVVGRVAPRTRMRIALEYLLLVTVWGTAVWIVTVNHWWEEFLVVLIVPALGAANVQVWRKFIEHVGLTGHSAATATRCVAPRDTLGRIVSALMLNENYHSAHHRFGSLHYTELEEATAKVHATDPDALPVFPSYFAAFVHMLPALVDPKVGAQWLHGRA
ncbi:MAG TPA: fatty acid desaturase [Burkholderiales bacterium]|nr:fatty acid desaturase [Burkholderiales bacterium]